MSNYSTLKAAISAVIKENNNHEITGQVLQTTLLAMVDSLAGGYLFKGIATPATVVGTPDENVFYIGGGGVYSNFGATPVNVPDGCIGIFTYNGSFENHIIPTGGVFDISAYNAVGGTPAMYADLTAALGTNGANIPDYLRKGGMSVKFIQGSAPSSDNNYVQFRCMAQNFTTDVTQWQGVDDEPTAGSKNLVESGGIFEAIKVSKSNAIFAYNSGNEPILSLDFTSRKLRVNNKRIYGYSNNEISFETSQNMTYETDFVGFLTKYRLFYLVAHEEDKKLYLVDFEAIDEYPEYIDGVKTNVILGGIAIQPNIDPVSCGFNFSCIEIDGTKYYGTYRDLGNPTQIISRDNITSNTAIDIDVTKILPNTRLCAVLESADLNKISIFNAYMYGGGSNYRLIRDGIDDTKIVYNGKIYISTILTQEDITNNRNRFRIYFNSIVGDSTISVNVTFSYFTSNIQWQDPRLLTKDLIASPLTIMSYNNDRPVFSLNFDTKKLSVNNSMVIICDGEKVLRNAGTSSTYETDFIGERVSRRRVSFLIYKITDGKLYLVDFEEIYNYPQYDANRYRQNIYIGSIIRQSDKIWCFGFNFAKINVDGVDYYGNYSQDFVFPITPEKTSFINKERTLNLFNKDTIVEGYYGTDGIIFQTDPMFWCSDYIEVEEGSKYIRKNNHSYFVYAYDESKVPVVVDVPNNKVYWQSLFEETTIPSSVKYIRVVFSADDKDFYYLYNQVNAPTSYQPYYEYRLDESIKIPQKTTFDESEVGNLQYQEINDTEYSQIIMYGQSLSMGWEAPECIVEPAIPNVYMVGDKVAIGHGNNGQNVLTPLISTMANKCGENPTVGAINAFASLYRRFVSKEQKFIATSCGEGGRSIEQLSKECTNNTPETTAANLYHTEFINALNRTKTTVDGLNKSVGCFAILFMQGEYNYINLTGGGMTVGTDATNNKDAYKSYLLSLKNNMQADIMAAYGQSQKPLFFIYEVAGSYINRFDMSINMAQIEFAQENDDVFLLSPTYPVPDYNGGHLSTNGYRWYGEMMAKSLYNVFIAGKSFSPLMPKQYSINNNTIRIDFYAPVLPLLFDSYTKELITDYGFRVQVNDADSTIYGIEIQNNSIILTMGVDLNGKKVAVAYAGQGRSGSGNLRDSDTYHSLYKYYDDRESSPSKRENYTPKDKDGNYIYGLPYPMFNWCGNFYKLVQESNN